MSRGTTRRIAFGRRTRTVPNSSRSVTKASPSGPPSKPPLRLRSTRVIAPGGGASGAWTTAAGWPASSSSSASRGAWSEARTIRAPSTCQRSTAWAIALPRPAGSCGSRQPNMSPDVRPRPASAPDSGRLRFPRQLERPAGDEPGLPRPRPDVRRRPVLRQLAALDQLGAPLVGLAPEEVGGLGDVAGLVEDEERVGRDVVEAARRGEERRPDLRGVADVQGPRRLARLEPLEVGGEALRQLRGPAPESLREPARAAEELRRREEGHPLQRPDGPLVGRVEGAERVDLVAEELDPDRQRRRRREDVDDAAAPRELAAAGDLGGRRVAEVEQLAQQLVLAETAVDDELPRRRREVVGRDRVLDEGLDARDEDPRAATPPGRQGRDARGGLVGDELAPLVGEGRPRLEDRDRVRIAEPRLELLGDPVADLRVASDPDEALAAFDERERRREVGLRAVGDGGQAGVPARARRCARGARRTTRSPRGAAAAR